VKKTTYVGGYIFVFFLSVLLVLPVFGGTTGKIKGVVVDKKTGEPLPVAHVIIEGTTIGAATNLDGEYYIFNTPPGTYTVKASMLGYILVKKVNVKVLIDMTTTINFEMERDLLPPLRPRVFAVDTVEEIEPEEIESTELKWTVITPHMEESIVPGKNLIYCSTFQLAWNMLQDEIIKDKVLLEGDPDMARLLNKQLSTKNDISKDCYVAMAGEITEEFLEQLNKTLREKFGDQAPTEVVSEINPEMPQILSYAYLYKNLKFEHQFEHLKEPICFKSEDAVTKIRAFGIDEYSAYNREHKALSKQISIIDYIDDDNFIIELMSESENDEIILAKIKPEPTLLQTIQTVSKKVLEKNNISSIKQDETLRIPRLDFNIRHSFDELIGKEVKNKGWDGWYIEKAVQWTRFKLNEKGALLKSEAKIVVAAANGGEPREFVFDKPFLIYLKQKNGKYPYFAMWVDNPGLLLK